MDMRPSLGVTQVCQSKTREEFGRLSSGWFSWPRRWARWTSIPGSGIRRALPMDAHSKRFLIQPIRQEPGMSRCTTSPRRGFRSGRGAKCHRVARCTFVDIKTMGAYGFRFLYSTAPWAFEASSSEHPSILGHTSKRRRRQGHNNLLRTPITTTPYVLPRRPDRYVLGLLRATVVPIGNSVGRRSNSLLPLAQSRKSVADSIEKARD